jgi:hypothetical protein
MIESSCVEDFNAITFYKYMLSDRHIMSPNTSIEEWKFLGNVYYIIRGEVGTDIDNWPLLIKPLPNGCWKAIKNFRTGYYDPTGQNFIISVRYGCVVEEVNFFDNTNGKGAEFIGYVWKKFPNHACWKQNIQIQY